MAFFKRHLTTIYIGIFCLLGSQSYAQAPDPAVSQFRVLSMAEVETLLFDVDKEPKYLTANVGKMSSLYPAPKSGDVVFYKESPNPDPKLPPIKTPLAKAHLPTGSIGPFIILIIPNSEGSILKFSTVVLDHSLEKFPANTYRVYNYSKRQLAVRLADIDLLLNTTESSSVPYPDSNKAWLKVAANDQDEGWLLVRSSPQSVSANTRTTIFLVDLKPTPRSPNPLGIMDRRMKERIYTDEDGRQYVR